MKLQNDLNENIRLTTIKIQEEHPELIKYINEIPTRFLLFKTEKEVNNIALKEYLESLNKILETYSKEH